MGWNDRDERDLWGGSSSRNVIFLVFISVASFIPWLICPPIAAWVFFISFLVAFHFHYCQLCTLELCCQWWKLEHSLISTFCLSGPNFTNRQNKKNPERKPNVFEDGFCLSVIFKPSFYIRVYIWILNLNEGAVLVWLNLILFQMNCIWLVWIKTLHASEKVGSGPCVHLPQ